jgi:hypothetical protein
VFAGRVVGVAVLICVGVADGCAANIVGVASGVWESSEGLVASVVMLHPNIISIAAIMKTANRCTMIAPSNRFDNAPHCRVIMPIDVLDFQPISTSIF